VLRRVLLLLGLVAVLVAGGGVAVARSTPQLATAGPTGVTGTEATAVYQVADRRIREVRYDDGGTLRYTFAVANAGRLPLTVRGLDPDQVKPRLFTFVSLTDGRGSETFRIGAGDEVTVTLALRMGGCETLSARAGSFVSEVGVVTRQAGVFDDTTTLHLPEELHTGSPREAFCPESTATSRPPG
jgi:hypothetical protein